MISNTPTSELPHCHQLQQIIPNERDENFSTNRICDLGVLTRRHAWIVLAWHSEETLCMEYNPSGASGGNTLRCLCQRAVVSLGYHSVLARNRYLHRVTCGRIQLEKGMHEQGTIELVVGIVRTHVICGHSASGGSLPRMRD